jgi:hypothetical protein
MASKFTITAELALQTKNLNQVVRNLQNQFQNANLNIKIKDLAQAQSHIQKISSASKQAAKDTSLLGNSMEQAFKRFTVITAVTGTLLAFTRGVKNAVSEAITFEREVVKIAQATNQSVSQLSGLVGEINSVSTSFGVASKELITAARTLTQAGFAADKVAGSLQVLAQTELAATFDSIQDTTEGAIALLNQFGKSAQRTGQEVAFLERSFSAINQVSKEFAVESSDLVTAVRTTGSAFESAGGNLNELLALFTSVRSTTRESAESIATGFRTIFTRVQRVDTINALRNLGVELQDVEGKFIGPMEAVKRLSVALSTIDPKDYRFNQVVEELGGFRQVSKVIPLIQQFAVAQQALNAAQNSGGSLAKDSATAQQALAVQIAKTREEFQRFMREMVGSKTFQDTARFLLDLANAFIQVADSIKPLIPLIASFAAFKLGSSLIPAIRSFGPGGARKGGIPIGFASGGLVPGSGNGDTVPAMLTPGEFVIRKSSVNKLGAENLAKVNKYADGGKILTDSKVGAAVLESGLEPKRFTITTASKGMDDKINVNKSWEAVVEGLSPESFNTFRNSIEDGLVKGLETAVNGASGLFAKDLGIKPVTLNAKDRDGFLETINRSSYGNLFEQVLTAYRGGSNLFAENDPLRPFDFDQGLNGVLRDDYKNLNGIDYVDAKASFSAASSESLARKIKNTILNERKDDEEYKSKRYLDESYKANKLKLIGIDKKSDIATAQEVESNLKARAASKLSELTIADRLRETFSGSEKGYGTQPLFKNGDPTRAFSLLYGQARKLSKASPEEIADYIMQNTVSQIKTLALGGFIHKFASGGFASGSDTVPAMLTPGEFVVNKKSAQNIGYSNLNRMNKVGKYAAGGVVQHFAAGGGVMSQADLAMVIEIKRALRQSQAGGNFGPQPRNVIQGETQLRAFLAMVDSLTKSGLEASNVLKMGYDKIKAGGVGGFTIGKDIGSAYKSANNPQVVSSTAAIDEQIRRFRELSDNSSRAAHNFLMVAGALESVIVQFSGLDESTKSAASAFGSSVAIYTGVASQAKSMGMEIYSSILASKKEKIERNLNSKAVNTNTGAFSKNTSSRVSDFASRGLKAFDAAISGFSIAMAGATAITAYYNKEAETSGKKSTDLLNKFLQDPSSVSKKELTESTAKSASDEGMASSISKKMTSWSTMAQVGGASLAGGLAGGPIGAILAGGATIGKIYYSAEIEAKKTAASLKNIGQSLGESLYSSGMALDRSRKFLEEIASKSDQDVFKELSAASADYSNEVSAQGSQLKAVLSEFKTFDKIPENTRQKFEALSANTKQLSIDFVKLVGETQKRSASRMASSGDMLGEYNKIIGQLAPTVYAQASKEIQNQNQKEILEKEAAGINTTELKKNAGNLADATGRKAAFDVAKASAESAVQITKQVMALQKEIALREALIGTLNEQIALQTGLENLRASFDRTDRSLASLDAAVNGTVSGLNSSTIDPKIFSVMTPMGDNLIEFNRGLSQVSSFSSVAAKLAENLTSLNLVVPQAETVFNSIGGKINDFADQATFDKNMDNMFKQFGVAASSSAGEALKKAFKSVFDPKEGKAPEGGLNTQEKIAKLVDSLKASREVVVKSLTEIASYQQEFENKSRTILDRILASQERELDMRLKGLDSQKTLFDNIRAARGQTGVNFEANETFRKGRQGLLAGKLGGDVKGLEQRLMGLNKALKMTSDPKIQAAVQSEAKRLKTALGELADQSGKTGDIMKKIEEAAAKRKVLTDKATEYAFSGAEARSKTDEGFLALANVFASGDIQAITDELKGSVSQLLEDFKDIPLLGGMTGKQIKKELAAREFEKGRNFDIANMIRRETSTPEEMMINELYKISANEISAREAMLRLELDSRQENTNALLKLEADMRDAPGNIFKRNMELEKTKRAGINQLGEKSDVKSLENQLELFKNKVFFAGQEIAKLGKTIEEINQKINPPQSKANGGLIFRAGGGSIFKPRGTDTVPAMLTPGEFVIKKSSVDKIGVGTLNSINAGYFAEGGPINVRHIDRRAARLRRESPEYAAAYAQSTDGVSERQNLEFYAGYNDVQTYGQSEEQIRQGIAQSRRAQQISSIFEQSKMANVGNVRSFAAKEEYANSLALTQRQNAEKRNRGEIAEQLSSIRSQNETEVSDRLYGREITGGFGRLRNIAMGLSANQSRSVQNATNQGFAGGLEQGRNSNAYKVASTVANITGVGGLATTAIDTAARYGSGEKISLDAATGLSLATSYGGTAIRAASKAPSVVKGAAAIGKQGVSKAATATRTAKDFASDKVKDLNYARQRRAWKSAEKNMSAEDYIKRYASSGRSSKVQNLPGGKISPIQTGHHRGVKFNTNMSKEEYRKAISQGARDNYHRMRGFASGGMVPAMLSPGEYIMNAGAVSKYGGGFMNHLNNGGQVKYLARGGQTSRSVQRMGVTDYLAAKQQDQQAVWDNKFQQQMAIKESKGFPTFAGPMGGGGGGGGGGMEEFGQFITKFQDATAKMSGMSMNHTVVVDGQLNIGGINGDMIASQIRDAIGNYVGDIVRRELSRQNSRPGAR